MNELPITQPESAHQVTVIQDGDGYLVRCNECERLFRISAGGVYELLIRGDMMASHSFGLGGMVIQGVKVRTEADADLEQLLEGIDI